MEIISPVNADKGISSEVLMNLMGKPHAAKTIKSYKLPMRVRLANQMNASFAMMNIMIGKHEFNDAFLISCMKNYVGAARVLLLLGVNIESVDSNGITGLMWAAHEGNENIIKLLLHCKAAVNYINIKDNNTALLLAAEQGHLGIVTMLVGNGANINHSNCDSETALSLAAYNNHLDVVTFLLEKKANPNHITRTGATALIWAVIGNNEQMVKLLLDKGANPEHCDANGHSVLSYAHGNRNIIKLMLEKKKKYYLYKLNTNKIIK